MAALGVKESDVIDETNLVISIDAGKKPKLLWVCITGTKSKGCSETPLLVLALVKACSQLWKSRCTTYAGKLYTGKNKIGARNVQMQAGNRTALLRRRPMLKSNHHKKEANPDQYILDRVQSNGNKKSQDFSDHRRDEIRHLARTKINGNLGDLDVSSLGKLMQIF
ncbi:hypothetical protein RF11_12066 [Thelohanellus kitauei]|uniref:Uncharacterized protein n=1 Tax=Thelohanellus kitauei TaxID=669202 RepID=A0A0C2MNI4_THEKT|nr:hypothetical protein RF11_12066 [Thelohanellus kitauei]